MPGFPWQILHVTNIGSRMAASLAADPTTSFKGYQNGDFNLSGNIDADDYFLIDSAFAQQASILATTPLTVLAAKANKHRGRHHGRG